VAGHSKWANIKHRKERQDQKRGKMWSKCSRAIMAAARAGGPDPDTNLALRYAIDEAKYVNMPKDTIKRAIDKGAGAAGGENFESMTYEGYGPAGAAVIVDALTDNKNRTVADLRHLFTKSGGNLGNAGCVAYMFDTKGQILVEAGKAEEDSIMEVAIEAGADDVRTPDGDDGYWAILTDVNDFQTVKDALDDAGIEIAEAEIAKIPQATNELAGADARKLLGLIESIEDHDDVQKVFANFEIPDEELAALESS
jgi:YebC/PmpR family DNA-binding regulatory protein